MVVLGQSVQYCNNNYLNNILMASGRQLFYFIYYAHLLIKTCNCDRFTVSSFSLSCQSVSQTKCALSLVLWHSKGETCLITNISHGDIYSSIYKEKKLFRFLNCQKNLYHLQVYCWIIHQRQDHKSFVIITVLQTSVLLLW